MARSKVRVVLNSANHRAILRSPQVQSDLLRRAQAIADAGGEGLEVDSGVGPNRARASVRTATAEARRSEAIDKTLTSAINAGRR